MVINNIKPDSTKQSWQYGIETHHATSNSHEPNITNTIHVDFLGIVLGFKEQQHGFMFIMFNHQTNIRMAWQTSRQWYNNVHATSKQPQTKHKFIRISGQDLTTGYHLHQHLNMSKNQSAQNLKLTMAIASVSIRQQEYSIKSHQINASMANRAEIYLYIKKKEIQISPS